MPNAARHLQPEDRVERLTTQVFIVSSLLALGVYLGWRAVSTLDGAFLPLAAGLLLVEVWFGVRHVLSVLPALVLRIDGRVGDPSVLFPVDVLVVVRDEPMRVLRVTVKSCLEVRGKAGVAVVNTHRRPEVDALCARLGIAVVDPERTPGLGAETGRRAEALILVPGSSWVSADIGAMAGPAFEDPEVGAVSLANITHGLVWLVGTRGYLPPVFGDDRMAVRLDSVGVGGVPNGPVVCTKAAIRSIGGVRWDALDPILATQHRIVSAGWRTRCISAPGSYRMAPSSEGLALRERVERTADWADAASHASDVVAHAEVPRSQAFWRRFIEVSAVVERWSVVARLLGFVVPMVALVTGRMPLVVRPVELLIFGGSWVAFGTLARRRAMGRRQAGVENARVGFRSLGADLAALLGRERWARFHMALQNLSMGVLLSGMAYSVWTTIGHERFGGPHTFERFILLAGLLVVPALIRDSTVAYRQQRLLPRVSHVSRGRGDIIELSPVGVDIDGVLPLGTTRGLDLALPLAGQRLVRRTVSATVVAHRRADKGTESYLRLFPDEELAVELAYFCGVTAPTMRWHGLEPRVVRRVDIETHRGEENMLAAAAP